MNVPRFKILVVLLLGAAIGYAVAASNSASSHLAGADTTSPEQSTNEQASAANNPVDDGTTQVAFQQPAPKKKAPAKEAPAKAGAKPNILVIFGDDIGTTNISAYSDGLMGYETPNIDRIANEGLRFLHYYGEQSCTAGRAAFLTGQHGLRTGLTKVGFPSAPMGMSQLDPSIGGLLKSLGYSTGQFGKNHVGDRNESLPTVNGFDEFFGNLYHLNAEEEPELPDYPKDPAYLAKFGPRGVLKCTASDKDDPTVDPRFGNIGSQIIEDTGALTKKRMETIDDETSAAAIDYMKRQQAAGKPFFCWFNSTRMHLRTHVREEHRGKYEHGDSEYLDGMIEHDATIGEILNSLDEMDIADNTIVVYTSDNGPHMNTWPDGAMTWFRSEKNTNWEGAFRVPCLVRWPGTIKPGTVTNELMSHNDWVPTLCAIAGDPDIIGKCKAGYTANGKTYKVHLDGYDQSAFLKTVEGTPGKNNGTKSARDKFFYTDDDAELVAYRHGDYKYVFEEQRAPGTMQVWAEPFTKLRLQKIFNLYQDPFERADITSNTFWDWQLNHVGSMYGVMEEIVVFAKTFKDYPPRSIPPSFNPATIMDETIKEIRAMRKLQSVYPMSGGAGGERKPESKPAPAQE
jgi:arylsulfatase A-like enzyme